MVELTVIVPSRNRKAVLLETLERLRRDARGLPVELIVIDDGSSDGTAGAARRLAEDSGCELRVVRQQAGGPAAARNRGITLAAGAACLFLGDDVRPRPGLLGRHLDFHGTHVETGAALLGRVIPAPPMDRSPFVRWLHEGGVQFAYADLDPDSHAPPTCFWTANVSVKTALLRSVGGFDEVFRDAACEDVELGLRLARAGMRLTYDPLALAEHDHPTDLAATLERMRIVGRSFRLLTDRAPSVPAPRRPSLRHRIRAAALTAACLAPMRPCAVRRATWKFLCDEAQREAYWDASPPPGDLVRVGARLARLAARDPRAGTASSPARGRPDASLSGSHEPTQADTASR